MFKTTTAESIANWGKPKQKIINHANKMTLKRPKELEKDIQNAILHYLRIKKVFCWRNNTGAMKTQDGRFLHWGAKGAPDIIAIRPATGQFIGIEVKTRKGVQSPAQRQFQANVEQSGGTYLVARSVDDVIAGLAGL